MGTFVNDKIEKCEKISIYLKGVQMADSNIGK